jgi:hypothetical protein
MTKLKNYNCGKVSERKEFRRVENHGNLTLFKTIADPISFLGIMNRRINLVSQHFIFTKVVIQGALG